MRWTRRHFVLCLPAAAACAAKPAAPDLADTLAKVNVFAFGGVGFAGQTSHGETAYRALIALPAAPQLFAEVYARGTPEACCYALVALRRVDPAKFQQLLATVRLSAVDVNEVQGCNMSKEKLGMVARQIANGFYDQQVDSDRRTPRA